jgi:uncharacterized membrane protein
MENTQNRFKSKVLWASIAATLLTLFGHFGLYEAIGVTQPDIQAVIDSVLALLVGFGILNNPQSVDHL